MAIRSAAKAVVVDGGRLLLIKSLNGSGIRYQFPGGGQLAFETLPEALRRECAEETGYDVEVGRLLAVCEEIANDRALRRRNPEYAHRLTHVFLCTLKSGAQAPTVADMGQIGFEWVPVDALPKLRVEPESVVRALPGLLEKEGAAYLGAQFL